MFEYSINSYQLVANSHLGFAISILCLFGYFFFILDFVVDCVQLLIKDLMYSIIISSIIPILIVVYIGVMSYKIDDSFDCSIIQEPIVAEFVSFLPEVYKERRGKQDVTSHKMYAQYRYKNDTFVFETSSTSSMPQYAQFYRVDVRQYPKCSKK